MNTYQDNLINALERLLLLDTTRDILSSKDEDVLQIFSGDERATIQGLHDFTKKHATITSVINDAPGIFEIRMYSIPTTSKGDIQ